MYNFTFFFLQILGSEYYDIKLSETGIVSVELDKNSKDLVITPLRIGQVSVELIDKCLMTESSFLHVSVVSIGKIEVQVIIIKIFTEREGEIINNFLTIFFQVPDRVEKTKTIEAIVKLYDSLDNLMVIDLNNLKIYELHEDIFNANILSVKLGLQHNLNVGEIRFVQHFFLCIRFLLLTFSIFFL